MEAKEENKRKPPSFRENSRWRLSVSYTNSENLREMQNCYIRYASASLVMYVQYMHACTLGLPICVNERNHKPLALSANQGVTESVAYWGEPYLGITDFILNVWSGAVSRILLSLNLDIKGLNI